MALSPKDKPLKDHVMPFLDYCEIEKGLSPNTQRNYRQYLELFKKWLHETSNDDLRPNELTAEQVWNYRLFLARKYISPRGVNLGKKSQNYYLIALRALLDYFADRDIESLPSTKVKLAKHKDEETISFLDINDMEKMLAVPDVKTGNGLRDRAIMELFFSSGMRISELVALNADQVSFLGDKKERTYELSIVGKGKHIRTIFISPRSADWLRKYLSARRDAEKPLFLNHKSRNAEDRRLSPRYIQIMISRYARLAGLSKRVTPHTLWHTHVTNKRLRDIHEKIHGRPDITK